VLFVQCHFFPCFSNVEIVYTGTYLM
jgi:hypothetical protein